MLTIGNASSNPERISFAATSPRGQVATSELPTPRYEPVSPLPDVTTTPPETPLTFAPVREEAGASRELFSGEGGEGVTGEGRQQPGTTAAPPLKGLDDDEVPSSVTFTTTAQ